MVYWLPSTVFSKIQIQLMYIFFVPISFQDLISWIKSHFLVTFLCHHFGNGILHFVFYDCPVSPVPSHPSIPSVLAHAIIFSVLLTYSLLPVKLRKLLLTDFFNLFSAIWQAVVHNPSMQCDLSPVYYNRYLCIQYQAYQQFFCSYNHLCTN